MKTTPENRVKSLGIALLNSYGDVVFHYPAVAGIYSVGGIPDRVGCVRGQMFGIEFKRLGGKPTALQKQVKKRIETAGGKWFLVDGGESLGAVKAWIDGLI